MITFTEFIEKLRENDSLKDYSFSLSNEFFTEKWEFDKVLTQWEFKEFVCSVVTETIGEDYVDDYRFIRDNFFRNNVIKSPRFKGVKWDIEILEGNIREYESDFDFSLVSGLFIVNDIDGRLNKVRKVPSACCMLYDNGNYNYSSTKGIMVYFINESKLYQFIKGFILKCKLEEGLI